MASINPIPAGTTADAETIEQAFNNFNQASEHLSAFYKGLEKQVTQLNDQLESAQQDKLLQYQEKEKLAHRLQNILRVLPAGIVVLDGEGRIAECNPVAESLFGLPLTGEFWRDVVERSFSPRWDDGHDITLRDGRIVNISTESLEPEPGQILLIKDVTETRELQEQFSQLKRLSALGEMAASLAHQIRTPLSAAMLYASNLKRSVIEEQIRQRFAGKIISRLQHLETLVEDMLLFSRGGRLESRETDAAGLAQAIAKTLAANQTGNSGRLQIRVDSLTGKLQANQNAVSSALQNLIDNAFQSGDDVNVAVVVRQPDASILLIEVADNGPGIPEQVQRQLFEPFFTTRTRGTGLGLAVVESVVRAHAGKITFNTSETSGTRFMIELPLIVESHNT